MGRGKIRVHFLAAITQLKWVAEVHDRMRNPFARGIYSLCTPLNNAQSLYLPFLTCREGAGLSDSTALEYSDVYQDTLYLRGSHGDYHTDPNVGWSSLKGMTPSKKSYF